jgi:hypothetical protein
VPVRRMIPYLMKTRNESAVYHEQILDLTKTLPFIAEWNRTREPKLTLFLLVLAACGRALAARPGLDRFVSGGRIYQRRRTAISFAAKQRFADDGPLLTIKLPMPRGEALADTLARAHESVGGKRAGRESASDREVKLLTRLPGFLLGWLVGAARWLDKWNLMPGAMLHDDPMYASLFLANLGSVGIDRVYHHLYEYGTVSLFGVLGATRKEVVVGADGAPVVRDTVSLRWSFDERINDGFYCAAALGLVRDLVEEPARFDA